MMESRVFSSHVLSLRINRRLPNEDDKPSKFAFIVSKKVAVRAVDRNKLKRRARAIVRELFGEIKDNFGCLLFFKKMATDLSYEELKKTIREIFIRARMI